MTMNQRLYPAVGIPSITAILLFDIDRFRKWLYDTNNQQRMFPKCREKDFLHFKKLVWVGVKWKVSNREMQLIIGSVPDGLIALARCSHIEAVCRQAVDSSCMEADAHSTSPANPRVLPCRKDIWKGVLPARPIIKEAIIFQTHTLPKNTEPWQLWLTTALLFPLMTPWSRS